MSTPLAYPVPEAAGLVGLGRSKFYELIRAGSIETVTVGSRRLVPAQALEAFVAQLRAQQRSA